MSPYSTPCRCAGSGGCPGGRAIRCAAAPSTAAAPAGRRSRRWRRRSPVPASRPPRATHVDAGRESDSGPSAVGGDGDGLTLPRRPGRAPPARIPSTADTVSSTANADVRRSPTPSAGPARPRSSAAQPGSACTGTVGSGRCQLIEHSTPSSGAAKAISCQRDPITAAASATAAQVAIAQRQRRCAPT